MFAIKSTVNFRKYAEALRKYMDLASWVKDRTRVLKETSQTKLTWRNHNRNCKSQTYKAPLESQAQGTSLFASAASNQTVFQKVVKGGFQGVQIQRQGRAAAKMGAIHSETRQSYTVP